MTVLDAYAVLALLKNEPAAATVEKLLRRDPRCALTTLGVAEVLDHLIRLAGVDQESAVLDVAQLGLAPPFVIDAYVATHSALLRARHYHRRHRAVSLADCVAAEVARRNGTAVVTSDPHLLDTCDAEGIAHLALPDTNGALWTR